MEKLDDNSEMPFGEHKGKKMAEVPDSWLKWYWETNLDLYVKNSPNLGINGYAVMDYINDFGAENLEA